MKFSTSLPFVIAAIELIGAVSPASAQVASLTFYGTYSAGPDVGDTPGTKKFKYEQAIALRDEAARLQAADGGTLTPQHISYIRRQADIIRRGDDMPPVGSLVRR